MATTWYVVPFTKMAAMTEKKNGNNAVSRQIKTAAVTSDVLMTHFYILGGSSL